MLTQLAASGAFVTQQTCGALHGWLGQGMPPSEALASLGLVAGVKSHLWVEPPPQHPANARNAAARAQGSNLDLHDIPVMVSQI
jgi:hypothetical protein